MALSMTSCIQGKDTGDVDAEVTNASNAASHSRLPDWRGGPALSLA